MNNLLKKIITLATITGVLVLVMVPSAMAQTTVDSTSMALAAKVAPGEMLPVSVKLSNFGGGKRVDVLVGYEILNSSDQKIYSASETVAVETTNSFVKSIQIPAGTPSGKYTAKTTIVYDGQLVPATTHFSFTVEPKILGLFRHDFYIYSGATTLVGVLMVLLGYNLVKSRKLRRFSPIDYSNIPKDKRVFYELISDTILSMRQQVGAQALVIAEQVDGLVIDKHTGRVLKLTEKPSKVVADLVAGYEMIFGKKVSFTFRNDTKNNGGTKL